MNKEESIDYINSIHDSYIKELQKQDEYIKKLENKNKKQKEVIDKAIEWVRDWTDDKNDWFYEDSKPSELLDILKEVE